MSSNDVAKRLDDVHRRILIGSRTASHELFVHALQPLRAFLAKSHPALGDDDVHDIAIDAILSYLKQPGRCDVTRASLWTYLCMVTLADAVDLFRTRARRLVLLRESAEDVADWSGHPNHVSKMDSAIDSRRIMELHGHKLATSDSERRFLALLLDGERSTAVFAETLGVDPKDEAAETIVKQAKDRMRLRIKRLRDAL
jgi:hypothetical protein